MEGICFTAPCPRQESLHAARTTEGVLPRHVREGFLPRHRRRGRTPSAARAAGKDSFHGPGWRGRNPSAATGGVEGLLPRPWVANPSTGRRPRGVEGFLPQFWAAWKDSFRGSGRGRNPSTPRRRSPSTPPGAVEGILPRKESFHAFHATRGRGRSPSTPPVAAEGFLPRHRFHATGAVEGVLSRHRRRARKSFHANRAVKGSLPRLAPRKKSFNSPVHRGKIPPCRGYTERAAPVHRLSRRVTGVSFSPQARLHYFVRPY